MTTQIFVNLPVKNLDKTVTFFTHLGFTFNPDFTDDKATCMIIAENIFAMLIVEEYFKTFTNKPIHDATKGTEVILALSSESREKVDELIDKAIEAGGTSPMAPQDHGWMYGRGFTDVDGHMWETIYMDPNGYPQA